MFIAFFPNSDPSTRIPRTLIEKLNFLIEEMCMTETGLNFQYFYMNSVIMQDGSDILPDAGHIENSIFHLLKMWTFLQIGLVSLT